MQSMPRGSSLAIGSQISEKSMEYWGLGLSDALAQKKAVFAVFLDEVTVWRNSHPDQTPEPEKLWDNYILEIKDFHEGVYNTAISLRQDCPSLFIKLFKDIRDTNLLSLDQYFSPYEGLKKFFRDKSLVELEIAALQVYLPTFQKYFDSHQRKNEQVASSGGAVTEDQQLERFDHALWRIKLDDNNELSWVSVEASTELYYQDVQAMLVEGFCDGDALPEDFEKIVALVPTPEDFNKHSLSEFLVNFIECLRKNIISVFFTESALQYAAIKEQRYIIKQMLGVYIDFFVAYVEKKHPSLMLDEKRNVTPLNLMITFVRKLSDEAQFSSEHSITKEEITTAFDALYNYISLLSTPAITKDEQAKQKVLYNALIELVGAEERDANALLEAIGLPTSFNILDVISSPVTINTHSIQFDTRTAEEILALVLLNNGKYLRSFSRESIGDKLYLAAILRLFKAFFSEHDLEKDILEQQQAVEALITFENPALNNILQSPGMQQSIFSANLEKVLSPGKLSTADQAFADAVTAVAIMWQYPTLLSEVVVITLEQKKTFNDIQSDDPRERLRLAVQWVQQWSSSSVEEKRSLPSIVKDYYKEQADSLHRYPGIYSESRCANLRTLIPVFFEHTDGDRSRAFNKGAIDLDEFLVPQAVLTLFDGVLDKIAAAEDKEKAIAEFIQKVLQECVSDTKSIFPSFENIPKVKGYLDGEVLHQIFGAQISYLKTKYVMDKGDNGKMLDAIIGILQQTAGKIIPENTSYEGVDAAIQQLNTTLPNHEQFGLKNSFSYKIASKIPALDDPSEEQCILFLSYCGGMSKQELDSLLRETYKPGFDNIAESLRSAAKKRDVTTLGSQIKKMTDAAKSLRSERLIASENYAMELKAALDTNTELPLYFDEKRIADYLKKEINKHIAENFYGNASDKSLILSLLNSHLPLSIKLKLIGSIALGNTEYLAPMVDAGIVHSFQAQVFYKRLSCFADVSAKNVSEKFTEFLKANGEPVAANVTNIEHVEQHSALLSLEALEGTEDVAVTSFKKLVVSEETPPNNNNDRFIFMLERRLKLALKSGDSIISDPVPDSVLPKDIPVAHDDFIGFIYTIFTTTKLNELYRRLVTTEKQTEFVAAVTKILLHSRNFKPDEEQRILAKAREMFIPVLLDYQQDQPEHNTLLGSEFFGDIKQRLAACNDVEQELWEILKDMSEYSLDKCRLLHDGASSSPTFISQLYAVLLERAYYFLQRLDNKRVESSASRDEQYGLISSSGKKHTLASLVLERMSQPEVARQEDTLDSILALNKAPVTGPAGERGKYKDYVVSKRKTLNRKINSNLQEKAVVDIWFALAAVNPETGAHNFSSEAVVDVHNNLYLVDIINGAISRAEETKAYDKLATILSIVMVTSVEYLTDTPGRMMLSQLVRNILSRYRSPNASEKVKAVLLPVLAMVVGKDAKATAFISDHIQSLAVSRQYDQLSHVVDLIPSDFDKPFEKAVERNVAVNTGRPRDEILRELRVEASEQEALQEDSQFEKEAIFFNDDKISQHLIKKLKAHLDGIVWPIEREAKEAMLKVLQSNLPLLTKLNVVGNIAQGLFNDASFVNTHGIRRRKEDHKLYGYLSGFAGITARQEILPQFTAFLKTSASGQVPNDISNVDHYVRHYAVIQRTLKLIDGKYLTGSARNYFRYIQENQKNISECSSEEVFAEIDHIQWFLKTYGKAVSSAISQQKLKPTVNKSHCETFRDWMELSIATQRSPGTEGFALIDVISLNAEDIADCLVFVDKNRDRLGDSAGIFIDVFVTKFTELQPLSSSEVNAFFITLRRGLYDLNKLDVSGLKKILAIFVDNSKKNKENMLLVFSQNIAQFLAELKMLTKYEEPARAQIKSALIETLLQLLRMPGLDKDNVLNRVMFSHDEIVINFSNADPKSQYLINAIESSQVPEKDMFLKLFQSSLDLDVKLKIMAAIAKDKLITDSNNAFYKSLNSMNASNDTQVMFSNFVESHVGLQHVDGSLEKYIKRYDLIQKSLAWLPVRDYKKIFSHMDRPKTYFGKLFKFESVLSSKKEAIQEAIDKHSDTWRAKGHSFQQQFKSWMDFSIQYGQPINPDDLEYICPRATEEDILACKQEIDDLEDEDDKEQLLRGLYHHWLMSQYSRKNFHEQLALTLQFCNQTAYPITLEWITASLPDLEGIDTIMPSDVLAYFNRILNEPPAQKIFQQLSQKSREDVVNELINCLTEKYGGQKNFLQILSNLHDVLCEALISRQSIFITRLENFSNWCEASVPKIKEMTALKSALVSYGELYGLQYNDRDIAATLTEVIRLVQADGSCTNGKALRILHGKLGNKVDATDRKFTYLNTLIAERFALSAESEIQPWQLSLHVAKELHAPNDVLFLLYDPRLHNADNSLERQAIFSCFVYLHPEKTADLLKELKQACADGLVEKDFEVLKLEVMVCFCKENSPAKQIELYQNMAPEYRDAIWENNVSASQTQPRERVQREVETGVLLNSEPQSGNQFMDDLAAVLSTHTVSWTRSQFFLGRQPPGGVQAIIKICKDSSLPDIAKLAQIKDIVFEKKASKAHQEIYDKLWEYFDTKQERVPESFDPNDLLALGALSNNLKAFITAAAAPVLQA